jgi:hypothetical protein
MIDPNNIVINNINSLEINEQGLHQIGCIFKDGDYLLRGFVKLDTPSKFSFVIMDDKDTIRQNTI